MRSKALTVAVVFGVMIAGAASAHGGEGRQVTVRPGESIQAAIDAAVPGTHIDVQAGTYHENLEIIKDGIHLEGHGAVLVPPASPRAVRCDAFPEAAPGSGICLAGVFNATTLTVTSPLNDVGVEGFTVRGFAGPGVLAVGVHDFEAEHNEFAHGRSYGTYTSRGSDITYRDNVSHDNADAGFYIGESQNANARVEDNHSFGNHAEGVIFRDSTTGRIEDNRVVGNCVGIVLLNTAAPGADGNATVADNRVSANNLVCGGDGGPPLSGLGILVAGATHSTVHDNEVTGNVPPAMSLAGGIVVIDTTVMGGTAPSDDRISDNRVRGNLPRDIFWDRSGSDIVFHENRCGTSSPKGLCISGD